MKIKTAVCLVMLPLWIVPAAIGFLLMISANATASIGARIAVAWTESKNYRKRT